MTVTVLQKNITWADPQANIQDAESLIETSDKSDLYVLPEMWSTGFAIEPKDIAETTKEDKGIAFQWMMSIAKNRRCAIAGSVAINDNGIYRNRFYFMMPDGTYKYYDKHHLFGYGGEDKHYTPGNERVVVDYKGIRFLLVTCYDLRFPIWERNFKDYDVMLIGANWPRTRQNAWQILLRARAIENQCFVVGVNRIGNDPYCDYEGKSAIIDAYGHTMASCKSDCRQSATANIEMEQLIRFRKKFPVLDEADKIEIS